MIDNQEYRDLSRSTSNKELKQSIDTLIEILVGLTRQEKLNTDLNIGQEIEITKKLLQDINLADEIKEKVSKLIQEIKNRLPQYPIMEMGDEHIKINTFYKDDFNDDDISNLPEIKLPSIEKKKNATHNKDKGLNSPKRKDGVEPPTKTNYSTSPSKNNDPILKPLKLKNRVNPPDAQ